MQAQYLGSNEFSFFLQTNFTAGGIFKETDVGRWVHLVCALYIPGLFPTDGEKLSLFKMPYAKFGAKLCCLCDDERLARTGVCIECDAGMCRSFFHASWYADFPSLSL